MKINIPYKIKILLFLTFITIAVIWSTKYILPYVIPFILAYWLAKYAYPISYFLKIKLHLPMGLCAFAVILIFLSILGILLCFFVNVFISQFTILLNNISIYKQETFRFIEKICLQCDTLIKTTDGTTIKFVNCQMNHIFKNASDNLFPCITIQTICIMKKTFCLLTTLFIILFSAVLIVSDLEHLKTMYQNSLFYNDINKILTQLSVTGIKYIKVQVFIIFIISILCTTGLFFNKSHYSLILGIIIAILDALPLFGSGTILIPWAFVNFFSNNITGAAILISTYLICQITRQFLESKLLGNTLGLAPIYFVISLFTGIQIFGITGIILGPFSILLIRTIYQLYKPINTN